MHWWSLRTYPRDASPICSISQVGNSNPSNSCLCHSLPHVPLPRHLLLRPINLLAQWLSLELLGPRFLPPSATMTLKYERRKVTCQRLPFSNINPHVKRPLLIPLLYPVGGIRPCPFDVIHAQYGQYACIMYAESNAPIIRA